VVEKTFDVKEELWEWVELQVRAGAYDTEDEYVGALIRRDRAARMSDLQETEQAIRDGLASGES